MQEGLVLVVVGMVTVFGFLVLLVAAMNLSARFFTAFAHRFAEETPVSAPTASQGDFTEIAVAIAAVQALVHKTLTDKKE